MCRPPCQGTGRSLTSTPRAPCTGPPSAHFRTHRSSRTANHAGGCDGRSWHLPALPVGCPLSPSPAGAPNAPLRSGSATADQNRGMARVTLQTIADRVGVSRMTVSNAFSDPISSRRSCAGESLRRPMTSVTSGPIRQLGRWRVAAPAPSACCSPTRSADAFSDEVAVTFLGAIADELEPSGLALTLLSSGRGDRIPARDVPMDGAFVYSCDTMSPGVEWLRRRKLPLVFVDHAPVAGIRASTSTIASGARGGRAHRPARPSAHRHPHGELLRPPWPRRRSRLRRRGTRHRAADAGLA